MASTPALRDIFVEANGIRHHLIARGTPGAPVVMMLHGLAGQAHTFDAIATRLAARFHVYCLDVRGRGESAWGPANEYGIDTYVADLEAVREALGLQRFMLVGTSMGGVITMHYAPKHPDRVAKAVLNDIGPEIDPAGLQRILSYVGGAPEMFADMKAVVRYYKEHYAPMVEHLPDDQIADFARYNVRKSDSGVYVWKMDPATGARAMWFDQPGPWSHEYFPRLSADGRWMVFGAAAEGHEHDTADYEIFLWEVGADPATATRLTWHTGNDCWPDLFVTAAPRE